MGDYVVGGNWLTYATKRPLNITFKRKQNPLHAKPEVISKLKSPTKHAPKLEVKSKLKSPAKAKPSPPPRNPILRTDKHAPPPANLKPKAPKLKASDVTKSDQGDCSGSEERDGSGSEEEGDEEEDEKEGDEEEDKEKGDEEDDEEEGEDKEDAIVKDEEYEEEEEEKVSEEEEEEEEEEDIKDKRLGRKNERRILKPSFFKRQKPCEEDDKGGKKEGSKVVPSSFFHAIRDAKVSMKRFMEDIGFSAFHSVNIDTLPNRSKFVVKRLLIIKPYNFTLKQESSRREDDEFLTSYLFANVMVKKTHEGIGKSLVVRRIHEDTNIAELTGVIFISPCPAISHDPNTDSDIYNGSIAFLILLYLDSTKFDCVPIIRSRPAIKNWSTKNMRTRQDLEIEDEAFVKLEFYGEWSENETVEAEGFCEYASVLPHTDKKIICEMIEEKLSSISKEKAEVETLLRDANKEFLNDDNVKQLFEQYKGFFKETVLLEEANAQKAPQNVKPKPVVVNIKEAAEKPKPAENVKELAEKANELAEKSQKAPQNVKPKLAAVKTKEAVEKPKPAAENVKELAEKPKEPDGDDYQVGNIDWVGEVRETSLIEKPVKPVNSPYMCRRIDVTARCKRVEFVLGNSLFAMEGDKYETVFQSLGGYRELSSVRVNMETLAPTLWIDANVIDCWVALLNFEELALGYPTPTRHFFPTGCINQGIIKGTLTEEEQWKSFLDEIKAQFKYEPSSMSLSDFELVFFPIYASNHFYVVVFNIKNPKTMVILDNSDSGYMYASKYKEACDPLKKLFSRYLKEQNHSSHEAVAKMRPFIPKLKWRTSNNHVDCGRLRYKIATKIMLHQFNDVSNKMFDFAFTFETNNTEQARVSMIVDAIKNRNNRDPPKQVKETDTANVVVGVKEAVDQVKEKGRRKK
ncbi:ulp1 protease family, C-terminal catalytic domain-containing protein [Tanacetum coccineum]|uniref:Ulp1 protease family, C-terminal catalytic domain-containing protein n=1 Tax=Tanacetum coccineum TaxID=301880 RepID=A0ABQ5AVU6_9ASTR